MANDVWEDLVKNLQCLPHVGPKSAQRIAFHLLTRERKKAEQLAKVLQHALDTLAYCELCRNVSAESPCSRCANPDRRRDLLCVVQSPMDLMAIDQTQQFEGLYFVLMGAISPLEGIGTKDIGLEALRRRLLLETEHPIRELVLATNFNAEGETTAHVIAEMLKAHNVKLTRLAHGVPVGGELEYLDIGTIAQALITRQQYQ